MAQPFTLLIKPSGSDCNVDCTYCFYKCRAPQIGAGRQRMSGEVLEKLVKDYMGLRFQMSGFAWQGGEPTLMGLDFYRRAIQWRGNSSPTTGGLIEDTRAHRAFHIQALRIDDQTRVEQRCGQRRRPKQVRQRFEGSRVGSKTSFQYVARCWLLSNSADALELSVACGLALSISSTNTSQRARHGSRGATTIARGLFGED